VEGQKEFNGMAKETIGKGEGSNGKSAKPVFLEKGNTK